ncbi:MAG: aminopeptidase P family protein [Acutalibacteraceae bacterium]|nr:aminopeptidase P family protein [Acutalibacteraceae bacterium]
MIFDKFLSLLPSELDGALIMSEENRRYFTSFPSSDGVLLISRNGTVFLTDSRYVEAAQKKITVCPVRLTKDLSTELPQLMSEFKINNLAVETTRLTVAQFEEFTKWMPDTGICTENYADRAIDALRMVKSDDEVKLVCEAQAIAERAFDHILEFIKPGVTEREIQLELDYYMLRNGAEALSFETIAVSGVNSSMPHGVPSDKKIENGDFITMDYGAVIGGYHSDMTRTVAVGSVSEEQKKIYNTVLEAQLAAMEKMAPGVSCADADKAARDVITDAGYGEFFGHGTGHGVGVENHEQPRVSPRSKEILAPGHLVTAEPGIYLPGLFGVRIEDMVLITEDGSRGLTHAPKELIIL